MIQQQSSNNVKEGRSRSPRANCDNYRKLQCNYFDQVEGFLVRPFLRSQVNCVKKSKVNDVLNGNKKCR